MRDANGVIDQNWFSPATGATGVWWSYELCTSQPNIDPKELRRHSSQVFPANRVRRSGYETMIIFWRGADSHGSRGGSRPR